MWFFSLLISVKFILWGALYGRLDGGGFVKTPEWIERSLIMFCFVIACAPFADLWSLAAYIGIVGIATGHGQYFLSLSKKAIEPEKTDFIVQLFFKEDPRANEELKDVRGDLWPNADEYQRLKLQKLIAEYGDKKLYRRSVFGMFVTGTLVGLPAFVLSVAFGQFYGIIFLLTGVVKALSYMISWKFWQSTEPAEYMNGGSRNAICLAVAILSIMLVL